MPWPLTMQEIFLSPNAINFISMVFFLYGRTLIKTNIERHKAIMLGCIIVDFALVIYLILQRNALGQVAMDMSTILKIHIPIATANVLCYFPALYYGYKLSKKNYKYLPAMRTLDKIVTPLRVLTFVTSAMVQAFA